MASEATVIELRGRVSSLEDQLAHLTHGQHLLRHVQETLDEIARLEDDWDSYGARRPTAAAISAAHILLGQLWDDLGYRVDERATPWAIAPLADGGVQIEWRSTDSAIEVEIDPDSSLHYVVEREERAVAKSDVAVSTPIGEILDAIRSVLVT